MPDFTPAPASIAAARAACSKISSFSWPRQHNVISEEEITISGRPAVKMIVKEVPDVWEQDAQQAQSFKRKNDDERARVAKQGKVAALLYVTNGQWTYTITATNTLKDINPEILKVIIDSVKFDN